MVSVSDLTFEKLTWPLNLKMNPIALFLTFSSFFISLVKHGSYTGHSYSSIDLTIVLYACCLVPDSVDLMM